MHFSLLVVTTDRFSETEALFKSLCLQTYTDFSVVFVYEEAGRHDADALVARYQSFFPIKPIPSASHGVSQKRNQGLGFMTGHLVAFPDDDCVYMANTLEEAHQLFGAHPHVAGLLARHRDLGSATPAAGSSTDVTTLDRFSLFRGSETYLQFYRRECVEAVGEFDEMMGGGSGYPYGCGEDTDYVLRAAENGFTIAYAPSIIVEHPAVNFANPYLVEKTASYACGRMFLLRKHRFPIWFRLANVLFPLIRIPLDIFRRGVKSVPYRWTMFTQRLKHF